MCEMARVFSLFAEAPDTMAWSAIGTAAEMEGVSPAAYSNMAAFCTTQSR